MGFKTSYFFNAFPPPSLISDVAVVDMSDISKQPSLFYHLGVRESFDMANNVILYHGTDADTAQSLKVRFSLKSCFISEKPLTTWSCQCLWFFFLKLSLSVIS